MENLKCPTKILALICTTFALAACSPSDSFVEESCSGDRCTERDINAPVEEGDENSEDSNESFEDITQDPTDQPDEVVDTNPNDELEEDAPAEEEPVPSGYTWPVFSSSWGIPSTMYTEAKNYYYANESWIPNLRYVTLIDFRQHSSKRRFYLFDLATGTVSRYLTSVGKNSDPDGNGYANSFSNVPGSKQSSLGFYLTKSTYSGSHGYSMRLAGLEASNSKAESRAIVVHPANYVQEENSYAGRSWGCPALDPDVSAGIINKIKNGSLLFIDYY